VSPCQSLWGCEAESKGAVVSRGLGRREDMEEGKRQGREKG
jgi:hypothetical protein